MSTFQVFLVSLFLIAADSSIVMAAGKTAGFVLPRYSKAVSLDFKNADLKDVLKIFAKQIGSNFIIAKDVGNMTITVYVDNVPVEDALEQVLMVNGLTYEYNEPLNLYIVKNKLLEETPLVTRVFALKYASVDTAKIRTASEATGSLTATLMLTLSSRGKIVDDPRTNSLIVTDVESRFPDFEKMLARLDVPVRQVVIEMEMLDVEKSVLDNLGSKFNFNARTLSPVKGVLYPWLTNRQTTMNVSSTATQSSGNLNFANSAMILDFLKQQATTKTLSRPRVTTMDNQMATIQITTDEVIGYTTVIGTGTNPTNTTNLERYTTGVTLKVTPQVNPVTNEIQLALEPKVIDSGGTKTILSTTDYKEPQERSVKVSICVANGSTAVIGGLLTRQDNGTSSNVPFLSKLPLIGWLFKYKAVNKSDRELMIFLTPYVIDSDKPMPLKLKKKVDGQLKTREQSFPDMRSGIIESEMNKYNAFRNGN